MVKQLGKSDPREESEAYLKVLYWFFSYPARELGLNELSAHLKISKTTANKIVAQLEKEGFLKTEVLGRLWRISCNLEHGYNISRKIPYNLSMIYESPIVDAIHKIIPSTRAIILFGSYRKGDDTEKSDIDIAVEVVDNEELRIVELGQLRQFGYRANVPVNVHVFSRNKIDLNLFSNIANGILLEGFLEVRI